MRSGRWATSLATGRGPTSVSDDCNSLKAICELLATTIGRRLIVLTSTISTPKLGRWWYGRATNSTPSSLAYLQRTPDYPIEAIPGGSFTVTHASPRHPVWEYVYNATIAHENFDYFGTPYCLVGHTHVPRVYRMVLDAETGHQHCTAHAPVLDLDIGLRGDQRLILNPGSVGQPRDKDPRAAYALLDTELETWRFRRVRYDFEVTQSQMRQAGLPERLIARLAYGW